MFDRKTIFLLMIFLLLPYIAIASSGDFQQTSEVSKKTTVDRSVIKHKKVKIADIIKFIDQSEAQGSLAGSGKTAIAAEGRLIAFRNLLSTADILLDMGDNHGACSQLQSASMKSDGQPDNSDYIKGPDVPELHQLITLFMNKLQCE